MTSPLVVVFIRSTDWTNKSWSHMCHILHLKTIKLLEVQDPKFCLLNFFVFSYVKNVMRFFLRLLSCLEPENLVCFYSCSLNS